MSEEQQKIPSPWLSIWIHPRLTMRRIAERDPDDMIFLLMSFAGFSEILVSASRFNLGDRISIPLIIALAILLGPVIGFSGMLIASCLFRWTGSWMNGKASYAMLRAAIAWSFVPIICFSIMWIPQFFLLGDLLFVSKVVLYGSKPFLIIVGLNISRLIIVIWSIVIFLACLCEVQKFPLWKSLLNCIFSAIIFFIAVLFIAAVIGVTIS